MCLVAQTALIQALGHPKDVLGALMQMQGQVYRSIAARKTQQVTIAGRDYFIKSHAGVGWREIIKNIICMRWPVLGATPEWHGILRCQALGISTLHAVAYAVRGWNPARQRSVLVTEALGNTISLEDFTRHWLTKPPPIHLKWALIKQVAEMVRVMHEGGVNHRDLYLCHFLFSPKTLQLFLIDLHRMQCRKRLPKRWQIKDLAGLYFSSLDCGLTQRDIFRFLREYSRGNVRQILARTDLWRRVVPRARQLYKKAFACDPVLPLSC